MDSVMNDNYGGGEKESLKDVEAANIEMSEFDDSRAKFIKKDADAPDVSIQIASPDKEFTGLTKEEIMEYANNPFWTKLRLALFILFWVGWIAMLAAAIIIIVLAPRCPFRPDHKWWQNEGMYQCYPQSFQDSMKKDEKPANPRAGDGFGDLKGFESRLDYLEDLDTKVVWMNSVFESDSYGLLNHTKLGARYGTDGELKHILKKMHKKGMKLVFDFIPNYTSKNHTWFLKSQADKKGPYADYYVWAPCTDDGPNAPSNWKSVYGGGAWKKDSKRGECYYHSFLEEQPDLNLRNAEVRKELKAVLEYWLGKGVDGFHVNDAPYLVEDAKFQDEPENGTGNGYDSLTHNATTHQPENYALMQEWNEIVNSFSKPGREKLLFTSMSGDVNSTLAYYGTKDAPGTHFIPSQALYDLPLPCNARCFHDRIQSVLADLPANISTGWRLSDQDHTRVASSIPQQYIKAIHTLQMLLPGTSINYYGDEIGLRDAPIAFDDVVDPLGLKAGQNGYKSVYRDPFRTPMRWDSSKNAGFTKGTPWLPIEGDQPTVQEHAAKFAEESSIEVFKTIAKLRKEPSFRWGKTEWSVMTDDILSFVRVAEGFPAYLVTINLGRDDTTAMFRDIPPATFSDSMQVVMHSSRPIDPATATFDPLVTAVTIKEGEAIVFKFDKKASEH